MGFITSGTKEKGFCWQQVLEVSFPEDYQNCKFNPEVVSHKNHLFWLDHVELEGLRLKSKLDYFNA